MQGRKGIPLARTTFISCKSQWLQKASQGESFIPTIHCTHDHFTKMLVQLKLLCLLLVCEVVSLQQQ